MIYGPIIDGRQSFTFEFADEPEKQETIALPRNALTEALLDWFDDYGHCSNDCDWNQCYQQIATEVGAKLGVTPEPHRVALFCEECSLPRGPAVVHHVTSEQAERIFYTAQGMLKDSEGSSSAECPMVLLAHSFDSEMYAEFTDASVEARGQNPMDDDYKERIRK